MEETKRCPYCGEEILAVARKCKHCGEWLDKKEPVKEKEPCPICGEMVDTDLEVCPFCKEPVNKWKDVEGASEPVTQEPLLPKKNLSKSEVNTNYVKLAFWAVVFGTILSFLSDYAELNTSEIGGLQGLLMWLGHIVPSWVGACLDGIGTIYLLWCVSNYIRVQKKAEGRDDDATSLLLKALSILNVTSNLVGCFAEEGVIVGVSVTLAVLMGILTAVNGFILKNEKDSMLANTGKAFIANALIALFMFRLFYKSGFDFIVFMWFAFFGYTAWIYAMFAAHKYLLKRNK